MLIDQSYEEFKIRYKGIVLQPNNQFVCDTCKKLITCPEDADLQYLEDRDTKEIFNFTIIHSALECDPYKKHEELNVNFVFRGIENLLGEAGLQRFLSIQQYGRIKNFNEYFFCLRRLFVPYYEQASIFFEQGFEDDFFIRFGFDEPYSSVALKGLIDHYNSI